MFQYRCHHIFCAHSYRPIDCVENKEGDTVRIFQCKYCGETRKMVYPRHKSV